MFDDWLEILLLGKFDVDLPTLMLAEGESVRFSGSGRLEWEAESAIRVRAYTDGAEGLQNQFGRGLAGLGQLIPHERYIAVTGRTQKGWDVKTTPVARDGYRIHSGSPHVVWDFTTHGLHLY